jgi:hypothetical protein
MNREDLKKELKATKKKILEGISKTDLWYYIERINILESMLLSYQEKT